MSILQKVPESIRAIVTKLKPVTQLRFLGPVGITSLVIVFFWQVSQHPDWLQIEPDPVVSSDDTLEGRLSDEEKAVAADIDSSGLLLQELQSNQTLPVFPNDPILAGEGVLDQVRKSRLNAAPSSPPDNSKNPLLSEFSATDSLPTLPVTPQPPTQNQTPPNSVPGNGLSPNSTVNGISNSLPPLNLGINTPTSGTTSENGLSSSPLQSAMDQYLQGQTTSGTSSGNQNSANSDQNSNSGSSGLNPTQFEVNTTPSTSTPTTVQQQVPQANWVVPRATVPSATTPTYSTPTPSFNPYQTNRSIPQPVIPTVPSTVPTVPNPNAGVYGAYPNVNPTSGSGYPYAYPGYSAPYPNNSSYPQYQAPQVNPQNYQVNQNPLNPATQQNQLNQLNQPFSAPRPIPGRFIGGGEINTFANP